VTPPANTMFNKEVDKSLNLKVEIGTDSLYFATTVPKTTFASPNNGEFTNAPSNPETFIVDLDNKKCEDKCQVFFHYQCPCCHILDAAQFVEETLGST
jgi:hypothetical protein